MAARRAHPVQRSRSQGLRGNRDACRPRRGVVGPSYGSFAFGQARKLIPSAGPPLPTEPASLGFGGGPNYCKRQWGGRQCAPGLCPVRTAHCRHGPRVQGRSPGGFPTAFDTKSGAPAESEAPGALPIKIQRSHLPKSGPSPGGIPAGGRRAGVVAPHGLVDTRASGRPQVAPTTSAQAADHSLPRKRESSFPPLGLLLPTTTTPLGRRGGPMEQA